MDRGSRRGSPRGWGVPVVMAAALALLVLLPSVAFAATTWTSPSPAPGGSTPLSNPVVSVTALDAVGLLPGGCTMKVDGVSVPRTKLTVTAVTGGLRISHQTSGLANGGHTVFVSVMNRQYKTYSYTWSFSVAPPLTIGQLTPADGETIDTGTPMISAVLTDGSSDTPSFEMTLDGEVVSAAFDPLTRTVSYTPHPALLNETSHTVVLEASNAAGSTASATWTFDVRLYAPLPESDCGDCHAGYPVPEHPTTDCAACHGDLRPIRDCSTCHPGVHGPEALQGWDCAYCHDGGWPTVPGHYAEMDSYHVAPGMEACTPCHSSFLNREHSRYGTPEEPPLSCVTCHGSTDARVVGAIAAGDTSCLACHSPVSGHPYGEVDHVADVAEDPLNETGATCGQCHETNLASEHERVSSSSAGTGCATCHPQPRASFGAWMQGCSQGQCHASGSPTEIHGGAGSAHGLPGSASSCTGCHGGADLTAIHASAETSTSEGQRTGCLVCHSPASVPGSGDCSSCHIGQGPDYHGDIAGAHTFSAMDPGCQACHSNQLAGAHEAFVGPSGRYPQYADTCALCHANEDPGRVPADATADCGTCHVVTPNHGFDPETHTAAVGADTISGAYPSGAKPVGYMYGTQGWANEPIADTGATALVTIYPTSPPSLFDKVDEYPADSDTTYLAFTSSGRAMFSSAAFDVPAGSTITAVKVVYRYRRALTGTCNIRSALKVGGAYYETVDPGASPTTSYYTRTYNYTVNPKTGLAWTRADIIDPSSADGLQEFGLYSSDADPSPRVTQCYLQVEWVMDPTLTYSTRCDTCHGMEVAGEHAKATSSAKADGCGACHGADGPRDSFGAWDESCSQGDCHVAGSATEMHAGYASVHTLSPGGQSDCAGYCHYADLPSEHHKALDVSEADATDWFVWHDVTCEACHTGAVAALSATWDGTCQACHQSYHAGIDAIHLTPNLGGGFGGGRRTCPLPQEGGGSCTTLGCHHDESPLAAASDVSVVHQGADGGCSNHMCHSMGPNFRPGATYIDDCGVCHFMTTY